MKNKKNFSSAYALFLGSGVLLLLSALTLSFLRFARVRNAGVEKQEKAFQSALDEKNERILSEWKNEPYGKGSGE